MNTGLRRTDPRARRRPPNRRTSRRLSAIGAVSPVSHAGIAVLSLAFTQAAHAYVGPALGLGAVAFALGGVGFFLFVLFTALWYPFKHLLRRRRAKTTAALRQDDEPHADSKAGDSGRH